MYLFIAVSAMTSFFLTSDNGVGLLIDYRC